MIVERIEDAAAFEKLREEWNALLEASASDCLFLTWEWLHTWWKHLAEDRALSILIVRRDGKLAAIAPLTVRFRKLTHLLPFPSLHFLGTGSVGSNYLDFIIRRGNERETLQALAEYLSRRGPVLELAEVNRNSSFAARLAAELGHRGWSSSESKLNICPFINLSGHSWETYLAALGANRRSDLRRRLRNLTKEFEVRFEQVRAEGERREALALLVNLHNMRWRDRGGSEAFYTPALASFHEEVSRLALERGWLRLFVLRLDGRPVASRYGFRYGRTYYSYQSGFDPGYSRQALGIITLALAIQGAIAEGAEEYDLLAGNEEYKFSWAREVRDLARLELWPPGARGVMYKRTMALARTVRGMARRVLPRSVVRRLAAGGRAEGWREPHVASPQ